MTQSPIRTLNIQKLQTEYASARPFPYFAIDGFLQDEFAQRVAAAYPDYQAARSIGREFDRVNERLKVQITDQARFPAAIRELADALSSRQWLETLESVTGIRGLVADGDLLGGGMHITGSGGRLDVHVDFNYIPDRQLQRRLNILVYLNPVWHEEWGGAIELWDDSVAECHASFLPVFNRCVVFETSDISFHGVTPVTAPAEKTRNSFAAYYYTHATARDWEGAMHSTVFRARPQERMRKYVMMPGEKFCDRVRHCYRRFTRAAGAMKKMAVEPHARSQPMPVASANEQAALPDDDISRNP